MSNDRLLTASLVLTLAASANAQTHVYVDDDAPAGGDGLSWNSAFNDLHDAIDLAKALGQNRGEIRIAGGTYKPDRGTTNQQMSFRIPIEMPNDRPFTLRGGFAGLELPSNPNLQNSADFPTVFDADLLGDDTSSGNLFDNSATIMTVGDESNPSVSTTSAIVLEGLTFRGAVSSAVRAPVSAVSLVLRDCNFNSNLGGVGAVMKLKDAMVTIEQCSFENNQVAFVIPNQPGDGVLDLEGCHSIISDSSFIGNRQSGNVFSDAVGAAISMRESDVVIVDSLFQGNLADDHGGALYIDSSNIEIYRSTFSFNKALQGRGGAIYAQFGSGYTLSVYDCSFEGNIADEDGGAIHSFERALIVGTDFTSNSARLGGAVYGWINAYDSRFEECQAYWNGGAASLTSGSVMDNCTFIRNSAGTGGAIDMSSTSLRSLRTHIRDSVFEYNESQSEGGAIRDPYTTANDGEVAIESCVFRYNNAQTYGGAVSGTNEITDSLFEENSSLQGGGAVLKAESIDGCTFRANSTEGTGGAIWNVSTIRQSIFINNRSSLGGAAINVNNLDLSITDSAFIENALQDEKAFVTISKSGTGNLDLTRTTMAGSLSGGSRFIDLAGGDHWIESSIIWNQEESGEATILAQNIERLIVLHSDISPNAIDIDNPDDYFDLGGNISSDPLLVDVSQSNIRLSANSPCIDAGLTFIPLDPNAIDVYGEPRAPFDVLGVPNVGQGAGGFLDMGATEFLGDSCLADTNRDGNLTPADFTAWLAAYNTGNPIADQNRDNALTPADFTAWVANYSAGCP